MSNVAARWKGRQPVEPGLFGGAFLDASKELEGTPQPLAVDASNKLLAGTILGAYRSFASP